MGKESGNYYSIVGLHIGVMLGLYRENGKDNGNYYNILDEEETLGTPGFRLA